MSIAAGLDCGHEPTDSCDDCGQPVCADIDCHNGYRWDGGAVVCFRPAPHPFRHPPTALNGACLDCGEHEEDGPHTAA